MKNENIEPEGLQKTQRTIIDLAIGSKEPENDKERLLLKEIEEIEARGNMVDLPLE